MPTETAPGIRRQYLAGVDTEPATGESVWIDTGDASLGGVVASFELMTLVGGTSPDVTPTLEHSPDKTQIHDLDVGSALSAVGQKHFYSTPNPSFRYIRYSWVTTGTPTSVTSDVHIEA